MAVFIELVTDVFNDSFDKARAAMGNRTGRAGKPVARRPLRGIEIKEDTYAALKVVGSDGRNIPIFDSSSQNGLSDADGYSNFILQEVTESRMEKQQIIETFGDSYIFFFGEEPRFLEIQAVLLNTADFNWKAEWWANYGQYLRGTKLVEMGARCYLFYDDNIIEGYIINAATKENSMQPYHLPLQFKFFVTNYSNISFVSPPDNIRFPVRAGAVLPEGIDLTQGDATQKLSTFLRGASLDQATQANLQQTNTDALGYATVSNPGAYPGPYAQWRKLSDMFRAAARSFAFSPDIYRQVESLPPAQQTEMKNLIERYGMPLRSNIYENVDEYAGMQTDVPHISMLGKDMPSAMSSMFRDITEADNLFREMIKYLSCFGADVNNPTAINNLGMGPSFVQGSGIGMGGAIASFSASARASANGASAGSRASSSVTTQFDQWSKDPLGSVFGPPRSSDTFGEDRPKYTEGAGDPLYGYPSSFSDGQPGFGMAGFGDFGGTGFGSGAGAGGDPGFKDPGDFTFAGIADNRSAFDRFMKPVQDNTAVTPGGMGVSYGSSGGSSQSVSGSISAFALISTNGSLDATGNARQDPAAIAARQESEKFGFSVDDPFGVNCPKTSPTNQGWSDGFSYSWP